MNKKRIMFLVLFFLSLISYTNTVSAGPSLCCSMPNDNLENTLIVFVFSAAVLFFIYVLLRIMLFFAAKKEERENNEKSKENI